MTRPADHCRPMEIVGEDKLAAHRLYKALHLSRRTGEGQILCALYAVPVYVCAMPDGEHFYFRHFQKDGSCRAITRTGFSEDQFNALRFHGQCESKRRIRLKALLAESIQADPAFSEQVVEGTWKGREGKECRRPDVRFQFGMCSMLHLRSNSPLRLAGSWPNGISSTRTTEPCWSGCSMSSTSSMTDR